MRLFKKALLVGSALLYPLIAFGEDVAAEDSMGGGDKTYLLQKSVVSASGFDQDIKDAPASISVVTNKELQEVDYHDLAEALFNVPGIDIGTEQGKTGGYSISIRGLPPTYTLYLVDGLRQNVAGNVGTNNSGWSQALNVFMPPRVAIDRIEVVRGPMSTLYGSDALGGVINVIVKKPNMQKWESAIELQSTVNENPQFGNYYGFNFYTSGPIIKNKLSLQLRGSYAYRSPSDVKFQYTDTTGVKKEGEPGLIGNPTEGNIYNIGARLAYAMDEANYFYFDFTNGYQNYDNRHEQLGKSTSSPKFYVNYRFNYVLAHLGKYDWGQTKTTLQYNNTVNLGRVNPYQRSDTDTTHDNRNIEGNDMIFQSQAALPLYTNSWFSDDLTVGVQYWLQTFHDNPYGTNRFPYTSSTGKKADTGVFTHEILYANPKGINTLKNQVAIYAENSSIFIDNIVLTLGARYTYDQFFGNNISPKAYLTYNALPWFQLRGGVSTGYRQPYLDETNALTYGFGAQGSFPFLGNPNLKPETSLSYEAGMVFSFDQAEFSAMYFRNDYKDMIGSEDLAYGEGNCIDPLVYGRNSSSGCSIRVNVDKAYTQGVELVFALRPIYGFSMNANYTFVDSQQLSGSKKGKPTTNTPQHSFNLTLNYNVLNKIDFYLQGVYKSRRYRNASKSVEEGIAKTKDGSYFAKWYLPYYAFNLGANYTINKNFRVSFGIQNLLNTNFVDYRGYMRGKSEDKFNLWNASYEGRRYFITLATTF